LEGAGDRAVYVAFGRSLGAEDTILYDAHGAGAVRGDPKSGDREDFPTATVGYQGDVQYVFNYVRIVRDINEVDTADLVYPIVETHTTNCYNDMIDFQCPLPGEAYYGQDGSYPPVPYVSVTNEPSVSPSDMPTTTATGISTSHPTRTPKNLRTVAPTTTPTLICDPYINDVEDMVFKGVGSNCRAGMDSSWPGALTCNSPYIVCLPKENTPAPDGFGGNPYKSPSFRYSVDECLQECAYDQRCEGAEFIADQNSSRGDCNLIDDLPLEIMLEENGFNYYSSKVYSNLDSSITGGDALCFVKEDQCNPYFEARELNDEMLGCYCPNNRKGYYTKKVKRTVASTRFCGNDPEIDTRIKKAQANRMFHLCENWCLFQTEDPEVEMWYYDPWNNCWREQFAGTGVHKSFCNRVIRSPDAIELQFVNHRRTLFCKTSQPTLSPSIMESVWYLAEEEYSCDDVCAKNGKVCDENLTATVIDGNSLAEGYYTEAGVTCASFKIGNVDWAFPGYEVSTRICVTRNSATENTGCNWAIGVGYKRLCACV